MTGQRKTPSLSEVKQNSDKVLDEIPRKPSLNHVDTTDKSKPVIPDDLKIEKNNHGEVFKEIEEGKTNLKNTETNDKSKPVIPDDIEIKESPHGKLLKEIEKPHDMNKVKAGGKA
ncbi:actobindin homolog [Zophobas morio]|uniref:actobindin homolog n=1 Tax=Zophobas morio TaxID=2755281 RepID=UPI003082A618